MGTWVYIAMVIIVFAARFAVDKLIDTTSIKVRFAMTMILIVLYTLFMEGFTCGDFYYFMRKRRKLSDVDKMKLKDL